MRISYSTARREAATLGLIASSLLGTGCWTVVDSFELFEGGGGRITIITVLTNNEREFDLARLPPFWKGGAYERSLESLQGNAALLQSLGFDRLSEVSQSRRRCSCRGESECKEGDPAGSRWVRRGFRITLGRLKSTARQPPEERTQGPGDSPRPAQPCERACDKALCHKGEIAVDNEVVHRLHEVLALRGDNLLRAHSATWARTEETVASTTLRRTPPAGSFDVERMGRGRAHTGSILEAKAPDRLRWVINHTQDTAFLGPPRGGIDRNQRITSTQVFDRDGTIGGQNPCVCREASVAATLEGLAFSLPRAFVRRPTNAPVGSRDVR